MRPFFGRTIWRVYGTIPGPPVKFDVKFDGHPNARGYGLIAEVVLSHLTANATRDRLKDGREFFPRGL